MCSLARCVCRGPQTDLSLLVANRRYDFGWGNGVHLEKLFVLSIGNQLLPGEWIELESPSYPHFLVSHGMTLRPYGAEPKRAARRGPRAPAGKRVTK